VVHWFAAMAVSSVCNIPMTGNGDVFADHVMKTCRSRNRAVLILYFGSRWWWVVHAPATLPSCETHWYPLKEYVGPETLIQ
jgi:hypothetical protein